MILPTPGPSFRWQQTAAGAALVCEPLEQFATHFFTTRYWTLGSPSADAADDVSWAQVEAVMAAPMGISRVRQVHGNGVVMAEPAGAPIREGDILITGDARLAIAVQAADCVPLLFVDPVRRVIAAAHAGWRGMVAGVPQATIAALGREFGCRPEELLVAAGPSIGACCYEVGTEVRDTFVGAGWNEDEISAWFHGEPKPTSANPSWPARAQLPGGTCPAPLRLQPAPDRESPRWFFDGWACTRRQLEATGVPSAQIHFAGLCTASHPDAFPSYRRDRSGAGRIAGVIRVA